MNAKQLCAAIDLAVLRSEATQSDEQQLLLLSKTDTPHDQLCARAAKVWQAYFGKPRASCMTRLDKGIKRKQTGCTLTVNDVRKGRRIDSKAAAPVDIATVESTAARGSSGIWSESMANELTFQKTKQYESRVQSYLENALLEDEVEPDLVDVALAVRQHVAKTDEQRTRSLSAR